MSLRSPHASVEGAVLARFRQIESGDGALRSLVLVGEAGALRHARALDDEAADGTEPRPLAGLTFVVKDNIDVAGQVTSCASHGHLGVPAAYDAPVVTRLRAAGAVLLGRANMDELAMGASTATSVHGATRNPHDHRRSPGGSSGGCAAAVAAGLADLAVGTDTGGSVREPAAQCGVLGLAPSPGLVPVGGVVPFDPTCDRVGPIAADAGVLAAALATMTGRTPRPVRGTGPGPGSGPGLGLGGSAELAGLRVGLVTELSDATNQPGVLARLHESADRLRALGAVVRPATVPDAPRALAAYLDLTSVAAARELAPWLAGGRCGPEVVRRLRLGRSLAEHRPGVLAEAAEVRQRLRAQVAAALTDHDVLLSPTLPTTAPLFAPAGPPNASVADPMLAPYTDCWTVVANLAGVPALSVPAGTSPADGMPVGVMLTGSVGSDDRLVALGALLARPCPLPDQPVPD
ncbi:amidase [Nocardioides sp. AX2bis]|uniref:amidase n=1 Tax=Nocardioides sp. AX2bis TaxID=2653157 RepID=UPI0012F3C063|nr:amidase [Nocardioides sp. AX2bis]VXB24243.1 Aspartyl-tRNA(Asn) amidotransferase subunit A [Nocardioides sp. AX2bis]